MASSFSESNRAYAALQATSSALVTKYSQRREPVLGKIPRGFELNGPRSLKRLLDPQAMSQDPEQRLARATAIAAHQVLESQRARRDHPLRLRHGGIAYEMSTKRERDELERQEQELRSLVGNDDTLISPLQMCRYCALFQSLLHQFSDVPLQVLNHDATIRSDFDPTTYVSEAGISDFQLFVPEELATLTLERSHPMLWRQAASDLFDCTAQGEPRGERPRKSWHHTDMAPEKWTEAAWAANAGRQYLYEEAKFPWNEEITSRIQNILAVDGFRDIRVPAADLMRSQPPIDGQSVTSRVRRFLKGARLGQRGVESASFKTKITPHDARILSYSYSLEACLGSTYGIGWEENGGLDIDEGAFTASAVHYSQISPGLVSGISPNDLVHLAHSLVQTHGAKAYDTAKMLFATARGHLAPPATPLKNGASDVTWAEANGRTLHKVGAALKTLWGGRDPWLVTVSASKRLRFTFPRNNVAELWQLLSWMTPAFLFTFVNRSVCQLPHYLLLTNQELNKHPAQGKPLDASLLQISDQLEAS